MHYHFWVLLSVHLQANEYIFFICSYKTSESRLYIVFACTFIQVNVHVRMYCHANKYWQWVLKSIKVVCGLQQVAQHCSGSRCARRRKRYEFVNLYVKYLQESYVYECGRMYWSSNISPSHGFSKKKYYYKICMYLHIYNPHFNTQIFWENSYICPSY